MDIPIELVVEDRLSEEVLRKILQSTGRPYQIGRCHCGRGFGYLKKNILGFNNAAKGMPYFVLTDLDNSECAPEKIRDWLPIPKNSNLIFRIAIREVESWILADRIRFAKFIGISRTHLPKLSDEIQDPKRLLIELTRKSRKRDIRDEIVPRLGSTAKQGPAYNERLCIFVRDYWNPHEAEKNSPSLMRTMRLMESFQPQWESELRN
jgi:hypothetical protein